MDESTHEGIYAVYATSKSSKGLALLILKAGTIVGIDLERVCIDGTYSEVERDGIEGFVKVIAPPNIKLVQGGSTGPSGFEYEMPFRLPLGFAQAPFCRLETPFGPLNLKFEKLRGLGAL
jgi:hypothetical protein